MMLKESDVKFYFKNGYLILENKLDNKTLSELKDAAKQLIDDFKNNRFTLIKNKERNISKHGKMFLANRCEDYPLMESFAKGSFIKGICKKILGEKIYLFNEQVVNKEPQTESKFAWHQDSGYVGYEHKTYLSIWIALCDVSENNGALRILPKNIENNVKIEKHIWSEQSSDLKMEVDENKTITCAIKEGGVILFSSRTPHASYPNKSDQKRPAYLCQYSSELIIPPIGSNKKFRTELI